MKCFCNLYLFKLCSKIVHKYASRMYFFLLKKRTDSSGLNWKFCEENQFP